jgi:hypothetical protein
VARERLRALVDLEKLAARLRLLASGDRAQARLVALPRDLFNRAKLSASALVEGMHLGPTAALALKAGSIVLVALGLADLVTFNSPLTGALLLVGGAVIFAATREAERSRDP